MKKISIASSILIIASVLLATACGPHGGHHFFPGHFGEKRIKHLERDLKLTEAQKAQFRGIMERMRKDIVADLEEKQEFMKSLEIRIQGDNPNINEIVALTRTHMKKGEARMEQKLDYITEFYAILNPQQKQQLLQKARAHLADKNEHMDEFIKDLKNKKED